MKKLGISIALVAMVCTTAFAGFATVGWVIDNAGISGPPVPGKDQTWVRVANTTGGVIVLTATAYDQNGGIFVPTPNTQALGAFGVGAFRPYGTSPEESLLFGPKPFSGAGSLAGTYRLQWTGGSNTDVILTASYYFGSVGDTTDPITGYTSFPQN